MLGKSGYGGGGSTGGGSGGIAATDWRLITGLTQANGNDIGGQITSMTEPVGGEYTWNFDATVAGALAADTGIIWDLRTDSDEDIFAEWAALDQPDAWAWQMLIEILSMPASTATNQWMGTGITNGDTTSSGLTCMGLLGNNAGATDQLGLDLYGNWGNNMNSPGLMAQRSRVANQFLRTFNPGIGVGTSDHGTVIHQTLLNGTPAHVRGVAASNSYEKFYDWNPKFSIGHYTVGTGTWSVSARLRHRLLPLAVI